MDTNINVDVDPTQGMLEDIKNPLQSQHIQHSLNKDISLNIINNDYNTAN